MGIGYLSLLALGVMAVAPSQEAKKDTEQAKRTHRFETLSAEQQLAFRRLVGACKRCIHDHGKKPLADRTDAAFEKLAEQFRRQHEVQRKGLSHAVEAKTRSRIADSLRAQAKIADRCHEFYRGAMNVSDVDEVTRKKLDAEVAERKSEFLGKHAQLSQFVRRSLGLTGKGRVVHPGKLARKPSKALDARRLAVGKFGCHVHLMKLYQYLVLYQNRYHKLPEGGGHKVLYELWDKVMEHSEANRDLFFCPAAGASEHIKKLKRMPVDKIWMKPEDFTSQDTHYAVAVRLLWSDKAAWISDDNEGGCCHADGSVSVLFGNGVIESLEIPKLVKAGVLTEKATREGFVIPVGADSPVPELRKLRR